MVIILDLSHPIAWLVRHVCSDKAEFSFLQKKTPFFEALSNVYRTDVWSVRYTRYHSHCTEKSVLQTLAFITRQYIGKKLILQPKRSVKSFYAALLKLNRGVKILAGNIHMIAV